MKITRMTETRLTRADVEAIIRMRRSLVDCQFAYLSDQVCVMLITEETDPAALAEMARDQMNEALSCMPDFSRCSACDDRALTLLHNGCVCSFAMPDEAEDSLGMHLYLRGLALGACELLPVLAIITGEGEAVEADPDTIDGTAPARDYVREMNALSGGSGEDGGQ